MKKLIRLILSIFTGSESCDGLDERDLVPVGWYIPKLSGGNNVIANGSIAVTYNSAENYITVEQKHDQDKLIDVKFGITPRVFTKINNVLKKKEYETIPRGLFKSWEEDIIEAQGEGENTYHSGRFPNQ